VYAGSRAQGRGCMREARRGRRERGCGRGRSSWRGQCRRAQELQGLLGLFLVVTAAAEAAEEEHAPRMVRYVCMTQQSTQQWMEGNVRIIRPTLPDSPGVRIFNKTPMVACCGRVQGLGRNAGGGATHSRAWCEQRCALAGEPRNPNPNLSPTPSYQHPCALKACQGKPVRTRPRSGT
jgi:hypothetical protein